MFRSSSKARKQKTRVARRRNPTGSIGGIIHNQWYLLYQSQILRSFVRSVVDIQVVPSGSGLHRIALRKVARE